MSKRQIKYHVLNPLAVFLVCVNKKQNKVIAYALIFTNKRTSVARLYGIGVLKSFRGQGIATQLIRKAEEICLKANKFVIRLEVKKTNRSAIHLYKNMGFRQIAEIQNYYDDFSTAIQLEKKLCTAPILQLNIIR